MKGIEFAHNAKSYHYHVSMFGVVKKGKSRKKTVIINLEQNYETFPPNKVFWDSLILLINRLLETHSLTWENVVATKAGKNLKLLLEDHKRRQ